jgi:GNAT superfamily N-acetyltransferase
MMTEITISQMERSEIPQVVELWNHAIEVQGQGYERHVQSTQRLEKIMEDQNFLREGALTAKQDGELVGFILGYVQTVDYLGEGGTDKIPARLSGVAVRPDKWRQGIGRQLLSSLEEVLASKGKPEVSFPVHHKMPLVLVRSIHLDSGPFFFLKACGYEDFGHELVFHNDISKFELANWVIERRERLEREGFSFRWYQPSDRAELLPFMERCFWPAWYAIIETATGGETVPKIMLAFKGDQIVGFIGPFDVGERRFYFSVDARSNWGGFGSPGVDPDFRQYGLGTVLWHWGFDYLKRAGAKFTEYGTDLINPAQHLYFHSGATLIEICCKDMRRRLNG